ncbi:MAG: DnaJ domain-containing protein [Oscillospiraceae bacterium]
MDKSKAYDVLGLPQNAGEDDIKQAYRGLAQKYSTDSYEAGPLREEAEAKMAELNEAFDTLMGALRVGDDAVRTTGPGAAPSGRYAAIRKMINSGQIDEALAELSAIQNAAADAEWNFLMGSAYYYKGWLDQAARYFSEAVRLDPSNREYAAALQNLQQSANGNMQGNPYGGQNADTAALNCACNTCSLMCCMDACCGMCR